MNRYVYVGGNALWATDERGEFSYVIPAVIIVGAVIAGASHHASQQAGGMTGSHHGIPGYSGNSGMKWPSVVYNEAKKDKDKEAQEEVAEEEDECPPVPDELIGEDDKRSEKDGRYKRKNKGPWKDGTGDAMDDFNHLTGNTGKPDPKNPDHLVGDNNIRYRPGKNGKGPRIDIPGKGAKPPETLHY